MNVQFHPGRLYSNHSICQFYDEHMLPFGNERGRGIIDPNIPGNRLYQKDNEDIALAPKTLPEIIGERFSRPMIDKVVALGSKVFFSETFEKIKKTGQFYTSSIYLPSFSSLFPGASAKTAFLNDDSKCPEPEIFEGKTQELCEQNVQVIDSDFTQKALSLLFQQIQELKEELSSLKEKVLSEEVRKNDKEAQDYLSQVAFGKTQWEEIFGHDVGDEPLLPNEILKILKEPCPFWDGKRVEETHVLVLIPRTIAEKPLTLGNFELFARNRKKGKLTARYSNPYGNLMSNRSPDASYWFLMTKDVIPSSRNKLYIDQLELIRNLGERAGLSYELPTTLEAVVGIVSHYLKTEEVLYGAEDVYIQCRDNSVISTGYHIGSQQRELIIGNKDPYINYDATDQRGTVALRKL